jgi:hypothetical protein
VLREIPSATCQRHRRELSRAAWTRQVVALRDLRAHLAPLLGTSADTMTAGQLSYGLRRLLHHGLVHRVPGTHRYTVPDHSLHLAYF